MNRRTFLGAAVAATILPAGETLADPAPGGRTIEAHETPEGVLYAVRDGKRETTAMVNARAPYRYIVCSAPTSEAVPDLDENVRAHRYLPHREIGQPVVNSFSRPPSLEDVLAFHEACCADVPRRVIDASDHPDGPLYKVREHLRLTESLCRSSLNPANRPVWLMASSRRALAFSSPPTAHVAEHEGSSAPTLSGVLAFHEQRAAEDYGPLTAARE